MDEIVRHLFFSPLLQGLFLGITLFYACMIFLFYRGWRALPPFENTCEDPLEKVTVIVPCHNEADPLPELVAALGRQTYPAALTEILLVDDHSEDATWQQMRKAAGKHPNIRVLQNSGHGKKEALLTGLAHSTTKWIVTTDADALPGPDWLSVVMAYRRQTGAGLIAGPVEIRPAKGFTAAFRSLEFYSLTGAGMGAAARGHPLYCNGANLAYKKEFPEAGTDPLRKDIPSGDDVFLLHTVKRNAPEAIRFLKSRKAAVTVTEAGGVLAFLRQRRRWASKSLAYRDRDTLLVAWEVFLMNAVLVFTLAAGFFDPLWWLWAAGLWGIKSLPDLILLQKVTSFYGQQRLMRFFPLVQLLYPLYVVLSALAGVLFFLLGRKRW